MKTRLLLLITLFSTLSYAQTFDWETGVLLSFGSSNQNITAKQIVGSYEVNFSAPGTGTPILLGNFGQGTTGKAVMNQQPQQVVRLSFFPSVDIQSLKAFSVYTNSTNWTFTPINSSGNAVVTANVAQNAVTVNLNWTNVSIIDITLTNGGSQNFGVDDIIFTPYVPCNVNIPDANFKFALIANTAINTNSDTEISCAEATAFAGSIDVRNKNIASLTGIEAFINITELICSDNSLLNINVSSNLALIGLFCHSNPLTTLDVSANLALETLLCLDTSLTSLDVSSNTALTRLDCYNNPLLSSLEVSGATALEKLRCENNPLLASLDVSNNVNLTRVLAKQNPLLVSLDVSNNTALRLLECYSGGLTSINVSGATALEHLAINFNALTVLDVSGATSLKFLDCRDNNLTSLNVANGNNTNFPMNSFFNAINNPNLTCIQVDDATYSTNNWTNIDATTSFSTNCATAGIHDFTLEGVSLSPNPSTSILNITMNTVLKQGTIYSVIGKEVLKTKETTINTANLERGVYIIKIENEAGAFTAKRFVKE